jgi:hypothetical protein
MALRSRVLVCSRSQQQDDYSNQAWKSRFPGRLRHAKTPDITHAIRRRKGWGQPAKGGRVTVNTAPRRLPSNKSWP